MRSQLSHKLTILLVDVMSWLGDGLESLGDRLSLIEFLHESVSGRDARLRKRIQLPFFRRRQRRSRPDEVQDNVVGVLWSGEEEEEEEEEEETRKGKG